MVSKSLMIEDWLNCFGHSVQIAFVLANVVAIPVHNGERRSFCSPNNYIRIHKSQSDLQSKVQKK